MPCNVVTYGKLHGRDIGCLFWCLLFVVGCAILLSGAVNVCREENPQRAGEIFAGLDDKEMASHLCSNREPNQAMVAKSGWTGETCTLIPFRLRNG